MKGNTRFSISSYCQFLATSVPPLSVFFLFGFVSRPASGLLNSPLLNNFLSEEHTERKYCLFGGDVWCSA